MKYEMICERGIHNECCDEVAREAKDWCLISMDLKTVDGCRIDVDLIRGSCLGKCPINGKEVTFSEVWTNEQ